MKIPNEINQMIYKRLIFLNPSFYKDYFGIKNGILVPKIPVPKNLAVPFIVVVKNVLLCYLMLILCSSQLMRKSKSTENDLTLIYSLTREQIIRNHKIEDLAIFLSEKRFNIKSDSEILVESKQVFFNKRQKNLNVCFDISLKLYTDCANFEKKIKIIRSIILKFIFLSKNFYKHRHLFLAAKEFIFDDTIIQTLKSDLKITKAITTISSLHYQPYIFETTVAENKRHMFWYSVNTIPFDYIHPVPGVEKWLQDDDLYKYMKIDVHWVWNLDHKSYLSKLTDANIFVMGSMVFYPRYNYGHEKRFDILLFDVTPPSAISMFHPIYNFDLMFRFVKDTLEISEEVSILTSETVKVALKHKRKISKQADMRYIDGLNDLEHNNKIQILNWSENLYSIIKSSKIVIAYPFTAPAVIAKELNVPSVYYLPENMLNSDKNVNGLAFFQNKKQLQKYILGLYTT